MAKTHWENDVIMEPIGHSEPPVIANVVDIPENIVTRIIHACKQVGGNYVAANVTLGPDEWIDLLREIGPLGFRNNQFIMGDTTPKHTLFGLPLYVDPNHSGIFVGCVEAKPLKWACST